MKIAEKGVRSFVAQNLEINWKTIKTYFDHLLGRDLDSAEALYQWLKDRSELASVLEEEFAWRYIRMNIKTDNQAYQDAFNFYIKEISPQVAPYEDKLNRKLDQSEFKESITEEGIEILLREVRNQIELFREENIPLFTKLEAESQKFGAISGQLSIEYSGKEYTLQQAAKFLKSTNREERKAVFELITAKRLSVKHELDSLFNTLIELRQQVSKNAAFDNYRDYKFKAMGRFDYSVDDCLKFHESVKNSFVPLANWVDEIRRGKMQIEQLKPYDTAVDIEGKDPLKPFEGGKELLQKTIACFERIDPFFADCLREMDKRKHLDLESKKGKAPGGFNYPLYESGLPFIFMNAVGSFRDITTMVHEGGHAVHSVLSNDLPLVEYKSLPSEIAELASMSMELISMDHWDIFFPNEDELNRAKRDQLFDVAKTLSWVATIDKFQHWIYTHKGHSEQERIEAWLAISREFGSQLVDWSDYPEAEKYIWQRQLHLYEVPFYYIEYGFAQLGAVAVWRNYRANPKKGIEQYKKALSLGYTATIDEVYQAAGIRFNFSEAYLNELAAFIKAEIQKTI